MNYCEHPDCPEQWREHDPLSACPWCDYDPLIAGATFVARRSSSGRRWKVAEYRRRKYRLVPLGDDVVAARSERTGRWQGGPRSIWRTEAELREAWTRA